LPNNPARFLDPAVIEDEFLGNGFAAVNFDASAAALTSTISQTVGGLFRSTNIVPVLDISPVGRTRWNLLFSGIFILPQIKDIRSQVYHGGGMRAQRVAGQDGDFANLL
jgi:hypothetical protein